MPQIEDERYFDFGVSLVPDSEAFKPVPDDYVATDPEYILIKMGHSYEIGIKNPSGITSKKPLGNSSDDCIPDLIAKFQCSDE
jgi:hypothetical protein